MSYLMEFIKFFIILVMLKVISNKFPTKIKKIEELIINIGIVFYLTMHFTNNKIVWEIGELTMAITILILIKPLVKIGIEVIENCYLKLKYYITK